MFAWLLAAALPLQGAAAATMIHCGPSHDRMARAEAAQAVAEGMQAAHAAHGAGHAAPTPHDAAPDLAKFKCSACAACCAASALPATVIHVASPPLAESFPPAAATVSAPYLTGALDRPPRRWNA